MRTLLICLIGLSLGCTSKPDSGVASPQAPSLLHYFMASQPAIRNSFTDVPINPSAFCTSGAADACSREIIDLQRELMALDPVPVPQPNTDLPVSVSEADQLYRRFVAGHANQPILVVFRQLFSRILLNKYGILHSTNYPLITYYTQELVASASFDLVTQAKALQAVQPHVSTAHFNALVQLATRNARRFEPLQKRQYEQLMTDLDKPDPDELLFPEEIRNRFREKVRNDNQAVEEAITQINQLAQSQVSSPQRL